MKILTFFLTFLLFGTNCLAKDKFFVAVNNKLPKQHITKDELKSLFLGKKIYWKNNLKVRLSLQNHKSNVAKVFSHTVLDKSIDEFYSYWRRKLFSGSGVPPRRFKHATELLEYIKHKEGSIGILSQKRQLSGIKYLKVK